MQVLSWDGGHRAAVSLGVIGGKRMSAIGAKQPLGLWGANDRFRGKADIGAKLHRSMTQNPAPTEAAGPNLGKVMGA
jgi:hypothetical protein